MSTDFAVNYSSEAADLLRKGQIQIDRFKCPAWPDLITTVQKSHPAYVHFPLRVGSGINGAIDTETGQPADWKKVETLLTQTDTPLVNVHLAPTAEDYTEIPVGTTDPAHIEMLTERMIEDVCAVVKRFGRERVIAENDHGLGVTHLRPAFLPEVIRRVIEETGCGFLFDVSHARLAAHNLDMDIREYINALPVEHTCEIHVTGIQRFKGRWVKVARRLGIESGIIEQYAGRLLDHLPMTDEDWEFIAWSMEQVHSGVWGQPWIVTFEYGGVGQLYKAVTDVGVLAEQIPRLYGLVKGCRSDEAAA